MNTNGEIDGNSIRGRLDRWLLVVCPTLLILTCLVASLSGRATAAHTSGNMASPATPVAYHVGFTARNLAPRQN